MNGSKAPTYQQYSIRLLTYFRETQKWIKECFVFILGKLLLTAVRRASRLKGIWGHLGKFLGYRDATWWRLQQESEQKTASSVKTTLWGRCVGNQVRDTLDKHGHLPQRIWGRVQAGWSCSIKILTLSMKLSMKEVSECGRKCWLLDTDMWGEQQKKEWREPSALDSYCPSNGIQLIPAQTCTE